MPARPSAALIKADDHESEEQQMEITIFIALLVLVLAGIAGGAILAQPTEGMQTGPGGRKLDDS